MLKVFWDALAVRPKVVCSSALYCVSEKQPTDGDNFVKS